MCYSLWRGWIDDGIAKLKRILSAGTERLVHSKDRSGTTIQAVVATLRTDIDAMCCQAFLLKLAGSRDSGFELIVVNPHGWRFHVMSILDHYVIDGIHVFDFPTVLLRRFFLLWPFTAHLGLQLAVA
jgi:hypothetical protein